MELTTNTKVWKYLAIIFATLTVLFGILFYFKDIFLSLVIASVFVVVINRIISMSPKGQDNYKIILKKSFSFLILIGVIFAIIFAFTYSVSDINGIIDRFENNNINFNSVVKNTIAYLPLNDEFVNSRGVDDAAELLEGFATSFFKDLIYSVSKSVYMSLLIVPIALYVYFTRKKKIVDKYNKIIPKKLKRSFDSGLRDIGHYLNEYLIAKVQESIIVGLIATVGFYLIGLPGWLFLGLLAGILNIIPYIGPILGGLPPLFIALIISPQMALFVMLIVAIAQIVDNFILIPFFVSKSANIDPLTGILLVLTLGTLYGATGMILAFPIYIIYTVILRESYEELKKLNPA